MTASGTRTSDVAHAHFERGQSLTDACKHRWTCSSALWRITLLCVIDQNEKDICALGLWRQEINWRAKSNRLECQRQSSTCHGTSRQNHDRHANARPQPPRRNAPHHRHSRPLRHHLIMKARILPKGKKPRGLSFCCQVGIVCLAWASDRWWIDGEDGVRNHTWFAIGRRRGVFVFCALWLFITIRFKKA